jgi:hypothetical protein
MLQFFRKIRYNLMSENKTGSSGHVSRSGKYFKYAFGEIVLVVIGILIALQINNWNENNKDRVYEHKMLFEIKKALEGDIAHFERMVSRMDRLDSAANVMAQHIVDKSKFIDSLFLNRGASRSYFLTTGTSNQFNPGPYEALKSSGIEKVTNDSLRNDLIHMYDFELPRRIALINWNERNYEAQNNMLNSFFGPTEVLSHEDHFDYVHKYPEDLFLNPEFAKLLGEIHKRARDVRGNFKRGIPVLQKLVTHIDTELNND